MYCWKNHRRVLFLHSPRGEFTRGKKFAGNCGMMKWYGYCLEHKCHTDDTCETIETVKLHSVNAVEKAKFKISNKATSSNCLLELSNI